MNETIILCGPAGAGKTARIVSEYVRHAERGGDDSAALIAPTARVAGELCAQIVALRPRGGLFDPRIYTFPLLAETLLDVNCRPVRRISDVQQRVLRADVCRRLAREGRLGYLEGAAAFPGFARAVGGLIDELKRAAVDPGQFVRAARERLPDHPANDDVAAIYAAYQRTLTQRGLYDAAGAFWEARDLLREGKRRPLDTVTLLLVDGFDEFTPTQLEMLEALCAGVPRAVITLCLEAGEERADVFAAPRRTRAELLARLPGAREKWLPAPPAATSLGRVRERIFAGADAPAGEPLHDDGTVRLLGAPGARAEVRLIARHVKDLLLGGTPPADIALVVRSLDAYEQPIREVFEQYGIPCRLSRGAPLAQGPAVQAVLDILDVLAGDWQRDDVVRLLNSNYVEPGGLVSEGEDALSADEVESLALRAGIIGGQPSWARRLNLLSTQLQREHERARAEAPEDDEEEAPRRRPLAEIERDSGLVERCAMLLAELIALLNPIAGARTWCEAARALGRAVEALGIVEQAVSAEAEDPGAARDAAGLGRLFAALEELGAADETLGAVERLAPGEPAQRIRELCRELRLDPDRPSEAVVEVLDAHEARRTRHEHVFLPGMVEGAFPLARRQDAFYHDDARRRLNAGRPLLEERLPRQAEEAFLFYEALAGAGRCVWLSYPTSDAEGKPVLRSHYVDEVVAHFATPPEEELVRLSEVAPQAQAACCPRELAEAAMRAAEGDDAPLDAALRLLPDLLPRVVHAAQVEGERDSRNPPGPYDGALSSRAAQAALAGRFGPRHIFSAAQFGDYGRCPMAFFFKRILGLEALEEPSEEPEVRDLGSLMHRALNVFFGERAGGEALMPQMLPEARARMTQVVHDVCAGMRVRAAHRALWAINEAEMLEDLLALLEQEAHWNAEGKYGPRAVWRTEYAYGKGGDFAVTHDGETLLVEGYIDRVDVILGAQPLQFVLLDYKRGGGETPAAIVRGVDFQLPLYYLAARERLFEGREAECAWWAYYRVRRPPKLVGAVYLEPTRKGQPALADVVRAAQDFMVQHARSIRAGRFPPMPPQQCSPFCDFGGVCRYSPYRMKAKGSQ